MPNSTTDWPLKAELLQRRLRLVPARAFSSATPAKTVRLRPSFSKLSTAPASSPGSTKKHWSEGRIGTSGFRDELAATDYALVLYTPALCKKTDSYVNQEIALARKRALGVRGSFLIPLRTADIDVEDRVAELSEYQEMPLRPAYFDQDLSKVVSIMLRDFQRRNR